MAVADLNVRWRGVRGRALLAFAAAMPIRGCMIDPDANGEVAFGVNVRELRSRAFANCLFLRKVSIPSWLTSIGEFAFYGCANLEAVIFEGDGQLTSIGEGAFQETPLSSILLPESLRYIGDQAFQYMPNLATIHIPGNVVTLGKNAFRCLPDSSELRSVTFTRPSSLVLIENGAFMGCAQLGQVIVPPACFVEEEAFDGTAAYYVKAPFPPRPPSPPPSLKPGDFDFAGSLKSGPGVAGRAAVFTSILVLCALLACTYQARTPDRASAPMAVIVVVDEKKSHGSPKSRMSEMSLRLADFEKRMQRMSFTQRTKKEPPPPPPLTDAQRARIASPVAELDVTPAGRIARLPPAAASGAEETAARAPRPQREYAPPEAYSDDESPDADSGEESPVAFSYEESPAPSAGILPAAAAKDADSSEESSVAFSDEKSPAILPVAAAKPPASATEPPAAAAEPPEQPETAPALAAEPRRVRSQPAADADGSAGPTSTKRSDWRERRRRANGSSAGDSLSANTAAGSVPPSPTEAPYTDARRKEESAADEQQSGGGRLSI